MVEPINLNRARKAKARAEDKASAAQNRVKHGRTGAEKAAMRLQAEHATRRLEDHKREE